MHHVQQPRMPAAPGLVHYTKPDTKIRSIRAPARGAPSKGFTRWRHQTALRPRKASGWRAAASCRIPVAVRETCQVCAAAILEGTERCPGAHLAGLPTAVNRTGTHVPEQVKPFERGAPTGPGPNPVYGHPLRVPLRVPLRGAYTEEAIALPVAHRACATSDLRGSPSPCQRLGYRRRSWPSPAG